MTQPPDPQLAAMQRQLDELTKGIASLNRAVQGDAENDMPSLRELYKGIDKRVELIEKQAELNRTYVNILMTFVRWLGLGTIGSIVGLVTQLMGLWGGHK